MWVLVIRKALNYLGGVSGHSRLKSTEPKSTKVLTLSLGFLGQIFYLPSKLGKLKLKLELNLNLNLKLGVEF